MTDTVASQAAYVTMRTPGDAVSSQSAYVTLRAPGVVVSSQTVYITLRKSANYSQAIMGTF